MGVQAQGFNSVATINIGHKEVTNSSFRPGAIDFNNKHYTDTIFYIAVGC